MYDLIKQPKKELEILFRNAAGKIGLHEAIVEKDFSQLQMERGFYI